MAQSVFYSPRGNAQHYPRNSEDSTVQLRQEAVAARRDTGRLRTTNNKLLKLIGKRKSGLDTLWHSLLGRQEDLLKRAAFLAMSSCSQRWRVWGKAGTSRCTGLWLWQRRILTAWRRTAEQRRQMESRSSVATIEEQLASARRRVGKLQTVLDESRSNVSQLEATLQECYDKQFEDTRRINELEHNVQTLKAICNGHVKKEDSELAISHDVFDRSVIKGLKRFFDKYNVQGVITALFQKVIELTGELRTATGELRSPKGESGVLASPAGLEKLCHSPSTCSLSGTPSPCSHRWFPCPTTLAEIHKQICVHTGNVVSRHALQRYVEGMHLNCSATMTTQVLLAMLGINVGEKLCSAKQFAETLASPPPLDRLFDVAMWGD